MLKSALQNWGEELPIRDLSDSRSYKFVLTPSAEILEGLASELQFLSLKKLRFEGELRPIGKRDWALTAKLGASVTQSCVTSLVPVTTRIEETVTRTYIANLKEIYSSDDEEIEMPDDETTEMLPVSLILSDIATEALSLAAPAYPRVQGAELDVTQFSEPGKKAMSDEDAKPFAVLKSMLGNQK